MVKIIQQKDILIHYLGKKVEILVLSIDLDVYSLKPIIIDRFIDKIYVKL